MKSNIVAVILFFVIQFEILYAENLYFPPLSSTATWETIDPLSIGWSKNGIDSLYSYLDKEETKGFIVLKDGKIVLEKYFGSFTQDSVWYWASAGKTLTSFLAGKAQEENYLSLTDKSSSYLGIGWTSCTREQEDKIKIINQLSMTTGLDDGVTDNHNTNPSELKYLSDAGTRWAYHNAPYTLLEKVLTTATKTEINTYTQTKLKNKTGITGKWIYVDYDNVFFSKPRSMARYGLLMQNNCIWNKDTLLYDTDYIKQMTNTSQNINLSYGYLWWLNGKSSYMVPTTQIVFKGSYAPNAPNDMFAGLGKNGQILSVSKSLGLVVVRMGKAATNAEVPTQLCNNIWKKLYVAMNNSSRIDDKSRVNYNMISAYPNPFNSSSTIKLSLDKKSEVRLLLYNSKGEFISEIYKGVLDSGINHINFDGKNLNSGIYFIRADKGINSNTIKIVLSK